MEHAKGNDGFTLEKVIETLYFYSKYKKDPQSVNTKIYHIARFHSVGLILCCTLLDALCRADRRIIQKKEALFPLPHLHTTSIVLTPLFGVNTLLLFLISWRRRWFCWTTKLSNPLTLKICFCTVARVVN